MIYQIIFFVWFATINATSNNIPRSQIDGLQWLYNSTNGTSWHWNRNPEAGNQWNFTAPIVNPCLQKWQGVTCTRNCTVKPSVDCNVVKLKLPRKGLIGTLPAAIDLLPELQVLDLRYNDRLVGTLPTAIASLQQLLELELEECGFFGTIPSLYALLANLRTINLSLNKLTGALPPELGQLGQLSKFWVHENYISGTLPTALGDLTNMTSFSAGGNPFGNGSIPFPTFVYERNWSKLQLFSMAEAGLTGTIPPEMGSLKQLDSIFLYMNSLTGRIPSELFELTRLKFLELNKNYLTGSLPSNALSVVGGLIFDVIDNYLTGTLPQVAESSNLYMIDGDFNFFSGPVPTSIGNAESLTGFFFYDNRLSGTLPLGLCQCHEFINFDVERNLIEGVFPNCPVDSWPKLKVLKITSNRMSGSLSSTALKAAPQLDFLSLQSNYFTGRLDHLHFPSELNLLSFASNRFSGPLPAQLFVQAPVLQTLLAASNRFTGSIPDTLCQAQNLTTLDLSGLAEQSSALSVLNYLSGVELASYISGTLPSCLFKNMSNLVNLYISGNGLRGQLEEFSPNYTSVRNVSLSFNRLTGTIPASMLQSNKLKLLDFSHNFLGGTIPAVSANSSSVMDAESAGISVLEKVVKLYGNRLSGDIPAAYLIKASPPPYDVDILAGNTFGCPVGGTAATGALPRSDPNNSKYFCGSNALSIAGIGIGVLIAGVLVACGAVIALVGWHKFGLHDLWEVTSLSVQYLTGRSVTITCAAVDHLAASLFQIRKLFAILSCSCMAVLLPAYVIVKAVDNQKYSMLTKQYGWGVSLGYLLGTVPSVIVGVLWCALLVLVLMLVHRIGCGSAKASQSSAATAAPELKNSPSTADDFASGPRSSQDIMEVARQSILSSWATFGSYVHRERYLILYLFANGVVALVVNGAYVYILLTQHVQWQLFCSVLIVIFKLAWNSQVLVPALDRLHGSFHLLLMAVLFNVVVAPMLGVAAVDVSCYQGLFVATDSIATNIYVRECYFYWNSSTCVPGFDDVTTMDNTFTPPFMYSGECSSAMLANYIPIYIATYVVMGVVQPVLQLLAMLYFRSGSSRHTVDRRQSEVTEGESAGKLQTKCAEELNVLSARQQQLRFVKKHLRYLQILSYGGLGRLTLPIESIDDFRSLRWPILPGAIRRDSEEAAVNRPLRHNFYHWKLRFMNLLVAFTLLLTFGMAYPPLAVVLLFYAVTSTLVLQLCIHSHYVSLTKSGDLPGAGVEEETPKSTDDSELLSTWKGMLQQELGDVDGTLVACAGPAVVFSVAFFCLFLSDMTGSLVACLVLPLLAFFAVLLWHRWMNSLRHSGPSSETVAGETAGDTAGGSDADSDKGVMGGSSADAGVELVENPLQGHERDQPRLQE